MSTEYLLTLLSDRLKEVENLIKKLKEQDNGQIDWKSPSLDAFGDNLIWLEGKVEKRRFEIAHQDNNQPACA